MLNFSYDVKINPGASVLQSGPLSTLCPNAGEMLITSKQYSNLVDCEKALSSVLSTLSAAERSMSDKNLVVVIKVNPLHSKELGKFNPEENWDDFTVMKAFVADAASLKKSELKYDIFAQIKTFDYANIVTYQ